MKKLYIIMTILFLCFTQQHLYSMENAELNRSKKTYENTMKILWLITTYIKKEIQEIPKCLEEITKCLEEGGEWIDRYAYKTRGDRPPY